jgi:branched-chain amino acid transport system ATP-binding protein
MSLANSGEQPAKRCCACNLSKAFGGVRAVAGVSFDLAPGELLALIGPNGAGKSTCFNMINGQLKPDAGSVALDGRDIAGLPPRARSGASGWVARSR